MYIINYSQLSKDVLMESSLGGLLCTTALNVVYGFVFVWDYFDTFSEPLDLESKHRANFLV